MKKTFLKTFTSGNNFLNKAIISNKSLKKYKNIIMNKPLSKIFKSISTLL